MTHLIEVENSFEMTRGDILVRRKSLEGTMEEQRASFPSYEDGAEEREKVSFFLELEEGEKNYVDISVDNQQEELGACKIDIYSNGPVTFIPPAAASITVFPLEDVETYTTLRIPSGPPTWKLEIMITSGPGSDVGDREGSQTSVTVGDDEPGGWG